jgi:hypothetical protein
MVCLNLYVSSWPLAALFYNVNYIYTIKAHGNKTALKIEIGDFGVLPNGQEYFDNSIIFAQNMANKIQHLATSNTEEIRIH